MSKRYKKLTNDQVLSIVSLKEDGHNNVDIAVRLGISPARVGNILRGQSWSWLTGISYSDYVSERVAAGVYCKTVPDETVAQIVELYRKGVRAPKIAKDLGVDIRMVNKYLRGECRTDITGIPLHNRRDILAASGIFPKTKLTVKDVHEIVALRKANVPQKVIGELKGVHPNYVSRIMTGRAWSRFTGIRSPSLDEI